jgi:hypothetical protein
MFGGADPAIAGLIPSDIEFRRNDCIKPLAWRRGSPGYNGARWSVKNLLELKNARRVLIEGNVLENNWVDAQTGYAVLFKSVNQDGAAAWSVTQDVEFRNNIVRHCSGGINIQGRASNQPGGRTSRIRIQNNLFEDIGGVWGGDGAFLKISDAEKITVDHNTIIQTGNIITAYGPPTSEFVFTNNHARHNQYGVKGDGTRPGIDTLSRFFPGFVFTGNAVVRGAKGLYPEGNFFPGGDDDPGASPVKASRGRPAPIRETGTDGKAIGCDLRELTGSRSR